MAQQSSFLSLGCMTKHTRADRFLDEMKQVVPWEELVRVVEPHYKNASSGRKPTDLLLLLKLHCLQLWYNLSDPGLEDAVHDRLSFQRFLSLDPLVQRVPDESTILHFRHLLEKHRLGEAIFARVREQLEAQGLLVKTGTIVDATILEAPASTKNQDQSRDPQMAATRKGGQWHFGMKAHIGADLKSGLVHSLTTSAANEHDSNFLGALTHGQEELLAADSAYGSMTLKALCRRVGVFYLINHKPGNGRSLTEKQRAENRRNSAIRAKVEFPFRVIKQLWGHTRVRYRGIAKNTSRLFMLFALSNLYLVRRTLLATA
jgi:IS5 family transposase